MPTPVGPAPRDPDDPDFWDWGGGEEEPEEAVAEWRVGRTLLAVIVVVLVVALVVAGL